MYRKPGQPPGFFIAETTYANLCGRKWNDMEDDFTFFRIAIQDNRRIGLAKILIVLYLGIINRKNFNPFKYD